MLVFPVLIAAAAVMQPAPAQATAPSIGNHGSGRAFMSPMGEPFFASGSSPNGLAAWFAQADTNKDGAITSDEMTADAERFFNLLDSKKDGEIDPDEVAHYEETMQAKGYRYSLLNIPEPVISADSDFNRGVSTAEFRRAALKRFKLLDLNRTGRLTMPVLNTVSDAAAAQAKPPLGHKEKYVPLDPNADTQSIIPPR